MFQNNPCFWLSKTFVTFKSFTILTWLHHVLDMTSNNMPVKYKTEKKRNTPILSHILHELLGLCLCEHPGLASSYCCPCKVTFSLPPLPCSLYLIFCGWQNASVNLAGHLCRVSPIRSDPLQNIVWISKTLRRSAFEREDVRLPGSGPSFVQSISTQPAPRPLFARCEAENMRAFLLWYVHSAALSYPRPRWRAIYSCVLISQP